MQNFLSVSSSVNRMVLTAPLTSKGCDGYLKTSYLMLCMFYSCSAMLGTFDVLYLLLASLWGMQFFFLQNGKEAQGVQASSSSLLSPIRDTKKRVHVTVS